MVNEDLGLCEYCEDGYHLSKGKCVVEGNFWSEDDN